MGIDSKITSKGQTTIPAEVRKVLGIGPGDLVSFEIDDGKVIMVKKQRALDLAGILHDPNRKTLSLVDMKSAWPQAALERDVRSGEGD